MFSEFISSSPQGKADGEADRERAGKRRNRSFGNKSFDLFFFLGQSPTEFVQRGFQLLGKRVGALARGIQHFIAGSAKQTRRIGL
jgi:hypothetical protein